MLSEQGGGSVTSAQLLISAAGRDCNDCIGTLANLLAKGAHINDIGQQRAHADMISSRDPVSEQRCNTTLIMGIEMWSLYSGPRRPGYDQTFSVPAALRVG